MVEHRHTHGDIRPHVASTRACSRARDKSNCPPQDTNIADATPGVGAVSIVIPTFCEAATAPRTIERVHQAVNWPHEIVVVDDSPTDATAEAIHDEHGTPSWLMVLRRGGSGLASAVIDGIDATAADVIVVLDADGQHPPDRVPALVTAVGGGADVAVGTRFSDGGAIAADWPLSRRVLSEGAAWAAGWTIPAARGLSDPMSGFFSVAAGAVRPYTDRLAPDGFKILLEILSRCPVEQVAEVGYEFQPREAGASTLNGSEVISFGRHLLRASVGSRVPTQEVEQ